ncbi:MAG: tetratricopeptide repeat protein [Bryobacteraceae bacterium]
MIALSNNDPLGRALRIEPDMTEAHYTLGITEWQAGNLEKTVEQMRIATEQRPEYAQAWFMLGTALKQKDDLDGAAAALRKSIALGIKDPGPYNTLGLILRQRGDEEGARMAFAKAADIERAAESDQAELLREGAAHGRQ